MVFLVGLGDNTRLVLQQAADELMRKEALIEETGKVGRAVACSSRVMCVLFAECPSLYRVLTVLREGIWVQNVRRVDQRLRNVQNELEAARNR